MLKFFKALWTTISAPQNHSSNSTESTIEDSVVGSVDDSLNNSHSVNPANGLPMLPGGAFDIMGNPFGTDTNNDTYNLNSTSLFDDHSSTFNNDLFNDIGGSYFDDKF